VVVPLGLLGADQHVEPVAPGTRRDRPAHHRPGRLVQHVGDGGGGGAGIERDRGVGLGVQVDDQGVHAVLQGGAGEPEGHGRLAHSTFQAEHGDDLHGEQPTPADDRGRAAASRW
jgi:hypothetical protein